MSIFNVFSTRARKEVAAPAALPSLPTTNTGSHLLAPLFGTDGLISLLATDSSFATPTQAGIAGIPAANRCVQIISNGVAMMLTSAGVYRNDDTQPLPERPLIIERPNHLYGSFTFWKEAVATALIHGNWIGIPTAYDFDGFPTQIIPVHPSLVDCRLSNGMPIYKILDDYYDYRSIIHVKGLSFPNEPWGLGVLEAQRKAVVAQIDMQNYSATTYRNGSIPPAILRVKGKQPTQEELDGLYDKFATATKGSNRKVVAMGDNMNIDVLAWSPEEAEFLESRKLSVAEMAYMFNLDPSDLGATVGGTSQTYANIEQRNIARILDTYLPWCTAFEQALSDLLPEGLYVKGNPEALLRSDAKTRAEIYQITDTLTGNGLYSIDELRALENKPPKGA